MIPMTTAMILRTTMITAMVLLSKDDEDKVKDGSTRDVIRIREESFISDPRESFGSPPSGRDDDDDDDDEDDDNEDEDDDDEDMRMRRQ